MSGSSKIDPQKLQDRRRRLASQRVSNLYFINCVRKVCDLAPIPKNGKKAANNSDDEGDDVDK